MPSAIAFTVAIACHMSLAIPHRMDEIDIWRTADAVIKQAGARAFFVAHKRAIAFMERGDAEGFEVWKRIAKAVESLQAEPLKTQPLH